MKEGWGHDTRLYGIVNRLPSNEKSGVMEKVLPVYDVMNVILSAKEILMNCGIYHQNKTLKSKYESL